MGEFGAQVLTESETKTLETVFRATRRTSFPSESSVGPFKNFMGNKLSHCPSLCLFYGHRLMQFMCTSSSSTRFELRFPRELFVFVVFFFSLCNYKNTKKLFICNVSHR